jgi:protease II
VEVCRRRAGGRAAGEIAFPEPAYSAHPHINRIFETTTFRYAYQSLVTPSSVYEYDVATGASTLLKQLEIPGGFDRTLYASERVHATAPDGVEVPVSIVYRKDKRAKAGRGRIRSMCTATGPMATRCRWASVPTG